MKNVNKRVESLKCHSDSRFKLSTQRHVLGFKDPTFYMILILFCCLTPISNYALICIPLTFDNPIEACFLNKKYTIWIQTLTPQIGNKYIAYWKTGLSRIFSDDLFTKLITYPICISLDPIKFLKIIVLHKFLLIFIISIET